MTIQTLTDLIGEDYLDAPLWADGDIGYKIPWHEPAFSRRMLREHLSQEHDMASRRTDAHGPQARWIKDTLALPDGASVLDLGCGPGLYAPHLCGLGLRYLGVDFSPASIDHALEHFAGPGCAFLHGNVLDAPLGRDHHLAMLLHGELNVFPPEDCARLLARAFEALAPGGRILLEVHGEAAVRAMGGVSAWGAEGGGLFSDAPHLWLMRGQWFEAEGAARQWFFTVPAQGAATVRAMCSTTKAWTDADYDRLLADAGFTDVRRATDWPFARAEYVVVHARKP